MKKEYIKNLEKALNEYNVENKKEILKKYNKRYDFGLESGLSEEKVEEMLGDPIEIAKKLAKVDEIIFIENKNYEININLSSEDISFVPSNDDGIHVEFEDLDINNYEVIKDDYNLKIEGKKTNYFGKKINGLIKIEIPKGLRIKKCEINSVLSDIDIFEINSDDLIIHTNVGDINIKTIQGEQIKINTVSGDVFINSIKGKNIKFETISGDYTIDSLISDELTASSVSGNIIINSAYVSKVNSNAISGDIIINGEKTGFSMKNSIKGTFNKIKKAFKNEKN